MKRRDLFAAAAAGAALSAVSRSAHAALDLSKPKDVLTALIKMRGRLDSQAAVWWLKGVRYGVVGTEIKPLFATNVASFHRFIPNGDDTYKLTVLEFSYYTDPDTGALLKGWKNPYTGAMNEVEYILFGPIKTTMTTAGMSAPPTVAGAKVGMRTLVGPVTVHGDDLWVREDTEATIYPPNPDIAPYRGNDLATYHSSLREVMDPTLKSAATTLHYQSVTAWRTWMKMGDNPGHLMAREVGSKVDSPADLPDGFQALARQVHPQMWAAMLKDLDGVLSQPPAESTYTR